ncbi:hypothetical protein CDD83_8605 [Cordyceps sp. RAO-2017]|nr:hypothetical protein CDD83_8605 [Cordyceps sp. RAO-2017]
MTPSSIIPGALLRFDESRLPPFVRRGATADAETAVACGLIASPGKRTPTIVARLAPGRTVSRRSQAATLAALPRPLRRGRPPIGLGKEEGDRMLVAALPACCSFVLVEPLGLCPCTLLILIFISPSTARTRRQRLRGRCSLPEDGVWKRSSRLSRPAGPRSLFSHAAPPAPEATWPASRPLV